ncbi:glycosyltransferase [Bosea sp. TWI1241]|uniref:glycosyltransferase n=1 Tax=Bosea sp. TWI1241 TaxID=3148904 RepID=UPI00320AAB47
MGHPLTTAPAGGARRPPRIGIVSLSAIPDDPRVRRQGDLFAARGWEVHAFGLPGALSRAPDWPISALSSADLDDQPPILDSQGNALWASLGRSRNARRLRKYLRLAQAWIDKRRMSEAYWAVDPRFAALYDLARHWRADIWLANDWNMLPIAQRIARQQGALYAYDTHELAMDEYAHLRRWRLLQRPIIAAVERKGSAGASVTSCVSQGIANHLQQFYGLRDKPLLIRNMPHYRAFPLRPCGETIEVLYHGVVSPARGLEACIESVALWRPELRLTIRGSGPADYLAALRERIEAAGLGKRIVLAPPVPMIELVEEAARFDIGLFALPSHSQQNVHVLPNKFFEYTMAGLALCVSDLPEMTALLRQYDLGRLVPEVTPQAIAATINGFDRVAIDAHKANALAAAKVLNWEAEADRFYSAIARAVRAADN